MLPQTEFTAGLLDDLRSAYTPGNAMSDAFARVVDRTLGDLGVVVFECSDRSAKPLAREIFAHEIAHGRLRVKPDNGSLPRVTTRKSRARRKTARRCFGSTAPEPRSRSQMRRLWSAKRAIIQKRSARMSSYGRSSKTHCFQR